MKNIRLFIVLSAVSLLMPSAVASAKTSMTLQKLSTIVQSSEEPTSLDVNVEGTYEGYTARVMAKSMMNSFDTISPLEGQFSLDAFVSLPTGGSVRVLVEGRIVQSTLYVRVNDLTVKNAQEFGINPDDYKNFLNTWIQFPLDTETLNQMSKAEKMKRSSNMKAYEKFIDITETVQANGVRTYTVSLSPKQQKRLMNTLVKKSRAYTTPRLNAETRKNIRNTTMTFDGFVEVLAHGQFKASQIAMSVMTKLNGKKAGFTLDAKSKTVPRVLIIAPEGSKPLEEIMDSFAPTETLEDARDAQRRADVNTILNAVYQYAIDNYGEYPASITMKETEICTSKQGSDCTGLVDLSKLHEMYLISIPGDPTAATKNSTKYTIVKTSDDMITVSAPAAEGGVKISVTR